MAHSISLSDTLPTATEAVTTAPQAAGLAVRTVGLLTFGGSLLGLCLLLAVTPSLVAAPIGLLTLLNGLILGGFGVYFSAGLFVGAGVFRDRPPSLGWMLAFWLPQIPIIGSPIVAFNLSTGLSVPLTLSFTDTLSAGAGFFAGTNFQLLLRQCLSLARFLAKVFQLTKWNSTNNISMRNTTTRAIPANGFI